MALTRQHSLLFQLLSAHQSQHWCILLVPRLLICNRAAELVIKDVFDTVVDK